MPIRSTNAHVFYFLVDWFSSRFADFQEDAHTTQECRVTFLPLSSLQDSLELYRFSPVSDYQKAIIDRLVTH